MTANLNKHRKINDDAVVLSLPQRPIALKEDDARLLELIALGDHEAFSTLVKRHTARFYRTAYRFVGQRGEAEDIVHDAFIKIWEKPTLWQQDKNASFTTWFYRIVVNLCLDTIKKKRPLQLVDGHQIEDDRLTNEEMLLEGEKQDLLEKEIKLLPDRQRTALNLCFYEGLSNQEAATVMGLNLKALQSLLMRAKTTLKDRLKFMTET